MCVWVGGVCLKNKQNKTVNRNLPASNPEGGSILPDINMNSLISKKERLAFEKIYQGQVILGASE